MLRGSEYDLMRNMSHHPHIARIINRAHVLGYQLSMRSMSVGDSPWLMQSHPVGHIGAIDSFLSQKPHVMENSRIVAPSLRSKVLDRSESPTSSK